MEVEQAAVLLEAKLLELQILEAVAVEIILEPLVVLVVPVS